MSFAEAEERLLAIDPGKWDLTLDRLRAVCEHLGNPQSERPCIVVGGSNGKGSVITFLASILAAPDESVPGADFAGGRMEREVHVEDVATAWHYDVFERARGARAREVADARALLTARGALPLKVGSFVKPHIFTIRERVRVDSEPIPEEEFARATEEAYAACDAASIKLTFFELTFLIAALAFRNAECDIALYEVGIGGRFDAVNVCTPFLSVITNVGADHEKYLGATARKQAFEKAGIIAESGIVVWGGIAAAASEDADSSGVASDADDVIATEAARKGAALIRVRDTFQHVRYDYAFDRQKVALRMEDLAALYGRPVMENERVFSIDQLGAYQSSNLDCTLYALYALKALGFDAGQHRFRTGLYRTNYRGRFDIMWKGEMRVILDAAHNPDGLKNLRSSIEMYLGPLNYFDPERIRVSTLFSCQEGKDVARALVELAPVVRSLRAVSVPVLKPMDARAIAEAARSVGINAVSEKDVRCAITACERNVGVNRTVLVCGSVYSLGAIYRELERRDYRRRCCELDGEA
jgi:dihydrofolate synthase/folylpolyglutamate synthase